MWHVIAASLFVPEICDMGTGDNTNEGWLLIDIVSLQKYPNNNLTCRNLNQSCKRTEQHGGLGAACQQSGNESQRGFTKRSLFLTPLFCDPVLILRVTKFRSKAPARKKEGVRRGNPK